jgi:NADH-quinone oxidoreductase subunit H
MFDWLTPQVVDTLIAVLQAVIILLVTVVSAALLSFVERRLLA